ncbi:unnamed protein product [Rhizoctonia solani]|uniref:Uncharacterized protein n=1 Tax=Rhizoctonia solani TaxID=456999 RepID=A0A8H3BFB4_9AGAM|nr:unnamed protein product [Rhizoctonia solani]
MNIIDGYASPGSSKLVAAISAAMTGDLKESYYTSAKLTHDPGKFFVLSLMINLVGQKYIREHFEQRRSHPSASNYLRDFQSQTGRGHASTVIQIAVHTVEIELPTRIDSKETKLDGPIDDRLERGLFDKASLSHPSVIKQGERQPGSVPSDVQSS